MEVESKGQTLYSGQYLMLMKERNFSDADIKRCLEKKEYLEEKGWPRSIETSSTVDKFGNPLPWITYEAVEHFSSILNKNMNVFEYGCGKSTLWLSKKVRTVNTCEHNIEWVHKIKAELKEPSNVTFHHITLEYGGEYCKMVSSIGFKFDVIFIDGRDRVNCLKNSVLALNSSGVIVLDNSDLKEYKEGIDFLLNLDFRKTDFFGMGPMLSSEWGTSFFAKE